MTTNVETLVSQIEDLKSDMTDNIASAVTEGMDDTADEMQQTIADNDSIASRRLYLEAKAENAATQGNVVERQKIRIPAVYKYVEYGTGPRGDGQFAAPDGVSPDMLENLQSWIDDKGVIGRDYSATPTPGEDWSPLAEAIGRTIVEVGTNPHPFVRPTWRGTQGKEHVHNKIRRGINRAIRRN